MPENSDKSPRRRNPNRVSPPREVLVEQNKVKDPNLGINPEIQEASSRTIELATDQSIAARHLMYYPNEKVLNVIKRCSEGVNAIVQNLGYTGNPTKDFSNDEILVSMFTRLMADGGNGRIIGFNDRIKALSKMKSENPRPIAYEEGVRSLANDCRANIEKIISAAQINGPDGAVARQGISSFMGDLGGIEKSETGFGGAFAKPICDSPEQIYRAYTDGTCIAQRQLNGITGVPSQAELDAFEKALHAARKATSMKAEPGGLPGVISAPAHTAGKKAERGAVTFNVEERHGMLNTGDDAEAKLKEVYPNHEKKVLDASWPSFLVSKAVSHDVVEPVSGHISGTFGEMATTMNLFCGTPPESITRGNPAGTPIASADEGQAVAIAAQAVSNLETSGFHTAVEVWQPMTTFTTQATHGSLGPQAVIETNKHAAALRAFAASPDSKAERPTTWEHDGHKLSGEELKLDNDSLLNKAESLENAATKSVDMIAVLQGGGTIATLDVNRVLANHSANPQVVRQLYSLKTRLEELGTMGNSAELQKARNIASQLVSPEQQAELRAAITAAENVIDLRNALNTTAAKAEEIAVKAEAAADKAEADVANVTVDPAFPELKADSALEEVATLLRADATKARAEANRAKAEALAAEASPDTAQDRASQVSAAKAHEISAKTDATGAVDKFLGIKERMKGLVNENKSDEPSPNKPSM